MARKMVTDDFRVFPERLSALMKKRNVTQEGLAHELGVKRQTVSLYKNGQSKPDAEQLKNIAAFFDVSADWLLGLSDIETSDKNIRNVCEYTGLSEDSIKWISEINAHQTMTESISKQILKCLNDLITSDDFPDILDGISNIRIFAQKAIEDHPEEFSDQWRDMLFHVNAATESLEGRASGIYSVVPNSVIIDSIKFSLSKTFNNIIDKLSLEK